MEELETLSPEREALAIVRALRAELERQLASGSVGLPRAVRSAAVAESAVAPPEFEAPRTSPVERAAVVERAAPPRPVYPTEPPASEAPEYPAFAQAPASAPHQPAAAAQSTAARPVAAARPEPARAPASDLDPTTYGLADPKRQQRLELLESQVRGCTRCRLHEGRKTTVFSRGTGRLGLCFVGEGPGAEEDEQGQPFVGPAGQLLDRLVATMGLLRDDIYVCNIVKCRPPGNRAPEPDESALCSGYLEQQLELLNPEIIVALGATAVRGLLGIQEPITRVRGSWRLYRGKVAVMPTFHPAYLLRTPSAKGPVWQDMVEVLKKLGRPVPDLKAARGPSRD